MTLGTLKTNGDFIAAYAGYINMVGPLDHKNKFKMAKSVIKLIYEQGEAKKQGAIYVPVYPPPPNTSSQKKKVSDFFVH